MQDNCLVWNLHNTWIAGLVLVWNCSSQRGEHQQGMCSVYHLQRNTITVIRVQHWLYCTRQQAAGRQLICTRFISLMSTFYSHNRLLSYAGMFIYSQSTLIQFVKIRLSDGTVCLLTISMAYGTRKFNALLKRAPL